MKFVKAPDVDTKIQQILQGVRFEYIKRGQVVGMRSWGSVSRARARIWAFPTIWQEALGLSPHYVIEVLSEKFDHLTEDEKIKILIHELLHIPKTFSGALRPHRMKKWSLGREVNKVFHFYKKLLK